MMNMPWRITCTLSLILDSTEKKVCPDDRRPQVLAMPHAHVVELAYILHAGTANASVRTTTWGISVVGKIHALLSRQLRQCRTSIPLESRSCHKSPFAS